MKWAFDRWPRVRLPYVRVAFWPALYLMPNVNVLFS